MMLRALSLSLFSVALAVAFASPANAEIRCDGRFQIVPGNGPVATPYCGDTYLAYVARTYGMRVSGRLMRQNPNEKYYVCAQIGFDSRVRDICAQVLGGRHRF